MSKDNLEHLEDADPNSRSSKSRKGRKGGTRQQQRRPPTSVDTRSADMQAQEQGYSRRSSSKYNNIRQNDLELSDDFYDDDSGDVENPSSVDSKKKKRKPSKKKKTDDENERDEEKKPVKDEETSTNVSQREFVRASVRNIIKATDQASPLLVSAMPLSCSFMIAGLLISAYLAGAMFKVSDLYFNCSEENGCKTCTVSTNKRQGQTCTPIAVPELQIDAGCVSIATLDNNATIVKDILVNTRTLIDELHNEESINDVLYESLRRHGELVDLVQTNKEDRNPTAVEKLLGSNAAVDTRTDRQIVDFNATEMRTFLSNHYFGLSDLLASEGNSTDISDEIAKSFGIKFLYSYITIGCVLNSRRQEAKGPYGDGFWIGDYDSDHGLVNYTGVYVCGCDLRCPTDMKTVLGTLDAGMDTYEAEQNGLGFTFLMLPDNYVQTPDYTLELPFLDQAATGEFVYQAIYSEEAHDEIMGDDDGQLPMNFTHIKHCSSTSIFSNTISTLNSPLYECCKTKTDSERMGDIGAFASVCVTMCVALTTVLFWNVQKKQAAEEGLTLQSQLALSFKANEE